MTFDYAEVDRITQLAECEGEAALSDYDREIYVAWTEYVEEAAPTIARKLARDLSAQTDLLPRAS